MERLQLPPRAVPEGSTIAFGDAVYAVRRWALVATLSGLMLAAAGAAVGYYLSASAYEATAMLQVSSQTPHLVFKEESYYADPFVPTQIELIRSPLVLATVVSDPQVAQLELIRRQKQPVDWLRAALEVNRLGNSELLEVKLSCAEPHAAAAIVNAVVNAYCDFQAQDRASRSRRMIELLAQDRAQRGTELQKLRDELKQMVVKDPALLELQHDRIVTGGAGTTIAEKLAATQADLYVQRAKLKSLEEAALSESIAADAYAVQSEVLRHASILRLNELIAEKQASIARTQAVAAGGRESTAANGLKAEAAALIDERERLKLTLESQIESQLVADEKAAMKQQQQTAAMELRGLEAMETKLLEQYGQADLEAPGVDRAGGTAMEFLYKQRELERHEMVYQQISDRADELQTEFHAPARVDALLAAEAPTPKPSSRLAKMGLAGGLGFLLPFGLVILWERRRRPVRDAEQIQQEANVEVVGELTFCPPRKLRYQNNRFGQDHQRLLYDESINALRTRLLLSGPLETCRVITVASAASGEGKTRVASQLAASLARSSAEPVLLIDADTRAPSIHRLFEVSNERGLTDVLAGRCNLEQVILRNFSPALHLLPSGRLLQNPHAIFQPEQLQAILKELSLEYRHIVIDTPPVLAAAESLTVAKLADGVLLCAMCDVSRSRRVEQARNHLQRVGANVLGLVVSGISSRRYESRYGSYYYTERFFETADIPERIGKAADLTIACQHPQVTTTND